MQLEVPGLGDFTRIAEAMSKKDEALLWDAAQQARSQSEFYERLRNECGMTSFSTGTKAQRLVRHHTAMIMVPLVLAPEAATLIGNAEQMKTLNQKIVQWLSEWFEYQSEVTIFNSPIGYEEICAWSPMDMRAKLERLSNIGNGSNASPEDVNFNLPADSPRLAFIVGAVQRAMEFPSLPPLNQLADANFIGRVSGALQVLTPSSRHVEMTTRVPDFGSEAIQAGLLQWLARLHAEIGIRRWDAMPAGKDVVVLQLELGDHAQKTSPVFLRAHQLGVEGIQKVLGYVASVGVGLLGRAIDGPAPMALH